MKIYFKTLFRTFKKHVARFLSLVFIVLISVGFISGIGSATDKIEYSMSDYYKSRTVSDFIIKSPFGFSREDKEKVRALFPDAEISYGTSADVSVGEKRSVRYYFLDLDNFTVNKPEVLEGRLPESPAEALAERSDNVIKGCNVGDVITLNLGGNSITLTVCGIVQSPLTFARDGEPSYNNPEDAAVPDSTSGAKNMDCLENIFYASSAYMPVTGDIYVAVADRSIFGAFSSEYKKYVHACVENINAELPEARVITLYENYSFKSLKSYGDKVRDLGYILMVAFLLVTTLVVLSSMTRLLDEERAQIACLRTLGFSAFAVISKYLLFALFATGIGGTGAYFVGIGLAHLIYYVFNYSFDMPPVSPSVAIVFYIITLAVIVAAALIATALSGIKMTNERPATLLRPKPPRAGKKVILEKIPFIWNRLPFKYKSTMRNVLRYKSRFIMTVVAVAFSTALVLTGLALLDLCLFHGFGSAAIMGIAAVIVIFAGLLTAVVIYTLTNINVSERNREIATLMVLGYHGREVSGYIYREVYINTLIGIAFGYPASLLLIKLVFTVMGHGAIGGISWFMWLLAPLVVLAFTAAVTLILLRKILGIDMNESLKAIE